jgi:hypothetical protein
VLRVNGTGLTSVTGSGSVTLNASPAIANPTISGEAWVPKISGGTTASSNLTVQSTSGAGTSDYIRFNTGSQVEAMRINTSGNVGIKNASPSNALDVGSGAGGVRGSFDIANLKSVTNVFPAEGDICMDSTNGVQFYGLTSGASVYEYRWMTGGGSAFMQIESSDGNLLIGYNSSNGSYKLQVNSQIFATNATIATSDRRYKENIAPIASGLSIVEGLKPVSFDWKEHDVHNFGKDRQVGFIAQDVQEALGDELYVDSIVRKNELKKDDGSVEEFLGLADTKLIPFLVKAIQELSAKVKELESKG